MVLLGDYMTLDGTFEGLYGTLWYFLLSRTFFSAKSYLWAIPFRTELWDTVK